MIEKYIITNELSRKRYRVFKKNKTAVFCVWALLIISFFGLTAELWANSRPVVLSYKSELFFPIFADYHPSEFGRQGMFVMNYRTLELGEDDWAIWPLIPWNPYERNTEVVNYPSAPSMDNWLGTDDRGRDILTRLLYGFRYTAAYAVGVWFFTFLLGTLAGALMGYFGGRTDLVGQRILEIFESMPYLMILLVLISIFSPNLLMLILLSVAFGWTFICAYIRAEFLSLRKREFVEAARALGARPWRIVSKHILPNALTPVITFSPFIIATYIGSLTILDYLGLGVQAPTPSWGELLEQAQKYFQYAWWLAVFPSLALFITLLLLNSIGDGVRDAFDSKKSV